MKKDDKIQDLREEIKDLKREAEYQKKEYDVRVKGIMLEEKASRLNLEKQIAKGEAELEGAKARIAESPYKQLQDILKALVVKLPTLDIKEISVHGKGK